MNRAEQLYKLTVLAEHAASTARLIQEQVAMLKRLYDEQENKRFIERSWYNDEGQLVIEKIEVESINENDTRY